MHAATSPHAIARHQLVDEVIHGLQQRVGVEFPVGQRLPPEGELMAQYGVGRSTIREAVRAFAHAGVLEVRQGDGTYVRAAPADAEPLARRLRRARVAEVYEVRRTLELEIARLAALRRSDVDVRQIREALRQWQQLMAGGGDAYLDADVAFHVAIAAASGNEVLADLYRTFAGVLRTALAEVVELPGSHRADAAVLHDQIAEAVIRQDAAAAYALTLEHLDGTDTLIAQQLADC